MILYIQRCSSLNDAKDFLFGAYILEIRIKLSISQLYYFKIPVLLTLGCSTNRCPKKFPHDDS